MRRVSRLSIETLRAEAIAEGDWTERLANLNRVLRAGRKRDQETEPAVLSQAEVAKRNQRKAAKIAGRNRYRRAARKMAGQ